MKRGFTLVELLVAVAMIVLLLAIALPALKAVTEGSHISDASRLISATIHQAKALAADTGRPHGIWIERSTRGGATLNETRANYCEKIYLAEVGPPYAGDIHSKAPNPAKPELIVPASLADIVGNGIARFYTNEVFMWTFYVKRGDRIQFGHSNKKLYTITSVPGDIPAAPGDPAGTFRISFASEFSDKPPVIGVSHRFRVFTAPRASGEPIVLPKRSAIDLDSSGMGALGTEFQPYVLPEPPYTPFRLWKQVGASGAGTVHDPVVDKNGNDLHIDPDPSLVRVDDSSSILIMFNPSGSVSGVYRGIPDETDLATSELELQRLTPSESIYLLLGTDDELTNGNNLYNGDSVWLAISPAGEVSSSANIPANTRLDDPNNPTTLLPPTELEYEAITAPGDAIEARRRLLISRWQIRNN